MIWVTSIDVSGCTSVTINFDWFIENGFDNGEYLRFDTKKDSGSWTQQDSLDGDSDEGSWYEFNDTSFDVTGVSNLYLRFRGKCSSSNEDAFVDDISVTAN